MSNLQVTKIRCSRVGHSSVVSRCSDT